MVYTFDQVKACVLGAFNRLGDILSVPATDPDLRMASDQRARQIQRPVSPTSQSGRPLWSTLGRRRPSEEAFARS